MPVSAVFVATEKEYLRLWLPHPPDN